MIDTINASGAGHTFNDNFFQGIHNLLINAINPTGTYLMGCVNWGASLNSTIKNLWCDTSGIGIAIGQSDGTSIQNSTVNVFGSAGAGQTAVTGQCLTITNGNSSQLYNSIRDLKCVYAGGFGTPPLQPGLLPSSGKYALEIGAGVQGLTIDNVNFENWPTGMYIGIGSHDIFIHNYTQLYDCLQVPNCTVRNYCENLIEPNTFNIHLEGNGQGFKYAICVGHAWAEAPTTLDTNQNFVIDQWGCIQKVTTGGTRGATYPVWPGEGCPLNTTSDGTVTWTGQGPITQICDPSSFGSNATFDPQGFQVNCSIPTVSINTVNVGRLLLSGPPGSSGVNDQGAYPFRYDSTTFWQSPPAYTPIIIGQLIGADFNSTADQVINPHFPSGV